MNKEYLTVKETAKELNITEQVVRNYLSQGILESKKIYNSTVIARKEVKRYEDLRKERR